MEDEDEDEEQGKRRTGRGWGGVTLYLLPISLSSLAGFILGGLSRWSHLCCIGGSEMNMAHMHT